MKHECEAYAAIDKDGEILTDEEGFNDYPLYQITWEPSILVRIINGDCDSELDEEGVPLKAWRSTKYPEVGYHVGHRVVKIKLCWES